MNNTIPRIPLLKNGLSSLEDESVNLERMELVISTFTNQGFIVFVQAQNNELADYVAVKGDQLLFIKDSHNGSEPMKIRKFTLAIS